MMRLTQPRGSARMTPPMEASSLSVGITTAVRGVRPGSPAALAVVLGGLMRSKAPAQPAARAGDGRFIGQESVTERSVGRAVPDLAQGLLRRIAERVILVSALRERRDAAGERTAIRRDIHDGPRPAAHRPRRAVVVPLETHARLGYGARRAECHAERARDGGGFLEMAGLLARHALVQRLVRPRVPARLSIDKNETLEVDLLHADLRRHLHESRQFRDRLLQTRQPGSPAGTVPALALLQVPQAPHIPLHP